MLVRKAMIFIEAPGLMEIFRIHISLQIYISDPKKNMPAKKDPLLLIRLKFLTGV